MSLPAPPPHPNSYQCPDCEKWINCGTSGMKFLESRHRGKGKCLADMAKLDRKRQGPCLKNMSIVGFLRPRAPVSHIPSQTQSPAPVTVAPAALTVVERKLEQEMPDLVSNSDDEPDLEPHLATVHFYKTPLANNFQALVDALPDKPTGTQEGHDLLSGLACDPALHDNPHVCDEELWEEVLNPLLKTILGWGTGLDVAAVVDGKRDGLMGVAPFIEYFVQRRRVSEGLLEGKLSHLMEGMTKIVKEAKAITVSLKTNTVEYNPSPASIIEKSGPKHPSPPAPVDVDQLVLPAKSIEDLTESRKTETVNICAGYKMPFPPGSSPHSNYPFALHDTQNLPWGYTVSNGVMVLHSTACTKTVDPGKAAISSV